MYSVLLLKPEKSLEDIPKTPYFRLTVHGIYGGTATAYHITAEQHTMEGGVSMLEAVDHLFKLFWIFGIHYTAGSENFYKFLENAVYGLREGSVPKPVTELVTILRRMVARDTNHAT